jgi:hypothetical protein
MPFSAPAVPCRAVSCRANKHMPFYAPSMLRHAVSFLKARVVAGKIRTVNPAVYWILLWSLLLPFLTVVSINRFEEGVITACGLYLLSEECKWSNITQFIMFRARGEEGKYHTLFGRLEDDKKYRSTAGAQHEYGMAYVNQTWSHCKNQVGTTQSKSLVTQRGRITAWARHCMCELALRTTRSTLHKMRVMYFLRLTVSLLSSFH